MKERTNSVTGMHSEIEQSFFGKMPKDSRYRLAENKYKEIYKKFIYPRMQLHRGWVEGYHDTSKYMLPTLFLQKIANGIVQQVLHQPIAFKEAEQDSVDILQTTYTKSNFFAAVQEAYSYALEGGTALLKWNQLDDNQLVAEALPMDRFFFKSNARGNLIEVKVILAEYSIENTDYYLCEERYFSGQEQADGQIKDVPMLRYSMYKVLQNKEGQEPEKITEWTSLPDEIQRAAALEQSDIVQALQAQGDSENGRELPFVEGLGCKLIQFTNNIPSLPKLPFGQPLADMLLHEFYAWEQVKRFEKIEMFAAQSRILLPHAYSNPDVPDNKYKVLDGIVFDYYDNLTQEHSKSLPESMQLSLRTEQIIQQKQNILKDVALALQISYATLASWLYGEQDMHTSIETKRFVQAQVRQLQEPLQTMIDIFFKYYGVTPPQIAIVLQEEAE